MITATPQSPLSTTGDARKAAYLERMLSNFTNSYKLYWLKGVFEEVVAGNAKAEIEDLARAYPQYAEEILDAVGRYQELLSN